MSRARPCTCIILGCQFYGHLKLADIQQIRRHLRKKHDYKDLQKVAFEHEIIQSLTDNRGQEWLIDKVADACLMREDYLEA
ncbi:MAG: hypothetical protein ACRD9Q_11610 [Nitrososphaeraceae archaeon]